MAESNGISKGWFLHISGTSGAPDDDRVTLMRRNPPPQIRLEIAASGIRSAGEDQKHQAHRVIQAAVTALQEALDSPSEIPGLR